jgi:hypothetical protein
MPGKKLRRSFHGYEQPIRVIRNIDEAIAPVESARIFVDGVHYHGNGRDVPAVLQCSFQGPMSRSSP